jgi:hypothetical protein
MPGSWDRHACSIKACSIAVDPPGVDGFDVLGGLSWADAPIAITPTKANTRNTDLIFAAMVARRTINVNQSAMQSGSMPIQTSPMRSSAIDNL